MTEHSIYGLPSRGFQDHVSRDSLATGRAGRGFLPLRPGPLSKGERVFAIGHPLDLGLTIVEGNYNGYIETDFARRIHYTGAINGGMSGGPALDAGGGVFGVNVSVITGRQLVGFVVPARHIAPLLARARAPLDESQSPQQVRNMVAQQALNHEAVLLDPGPLPNETQTVFGFTLPTRMGTAFECSTTGASEARETSAPSSAARAMPPAATMARISSSSRRTLSTSSSGLATCTAPPPSRGSVSTRRWSPATVWSCSSAPLFPSATSLASAVSGTLIVSWAGAWRSPPAELMS